MRAQEAHVSEPPRIPLGDGNQTRMTDLPPPPSLMGGPDGGDQGPPGVRVLAQYIRDLSFENPLAPDSLRAAATQPQVDLGVELNAKGRPDGLFDVELKLTARATRENDTVFHVELPLARDSHARPPHPDRESDPQELRHESVAP